MCETLAIEHTTPLIPAWAPLLHFPHNVPEPPWPMDSTITTVRPWSWLDSQRYNMRNGEAIEPNIFCFPSIGITCFLSPLASSNLCRSQNRSPELVADFHGCESRLNPTTSMGGGEKYEFILDLV